MERTVGIYSGALGYGHKEDLLKMQGLPVPACWKDLIKPVRKGKVPVANPTCRYVLQHTHKRVPLVSGLGGMFEGQVRSLRPGDVMLVVSFLPYTEESLQCARLVAITDSQTSPFAALQHARRPQQLDGLVSQHRLNRRDPGTELLREACGCGGDRVANSLQLHT